MNRLISIVIIIGAFALIYLTSNSSVPTLTVDSGFLSKEQRASTTRTSPQNSWNITGPEDNTEKLADIALQTDEAINYSGQIKFGPEKVIADTEINPKESAIYDKPIGSELKDYGNLIALPIKTAFSQINESEIIDKLIRNQDKPSQDKILGLKNTYANLSMKISAVTPPEKIKSLSLQLMQTYSNQASALEKIIDSELPVEQNKFLNYNNAVFATGDILEQIILFFKNQGIRFGANEPGSIFNLTF